MNIVTKATGDSLTAQEFNQIPDELETLITSAGLSPSELDLTQVSKSISQYVCDGDFYSTSGTANEIILSNITPRQAPVSLTTGLKARFIATNTNTGATTINLCNLGAKPILYNGNALVAGDIIQNEKYEIIYNSSNQNFDLIKTVNPTVFSYTNVAEMKADTKLSNGNICLTKGYYTEGDRGNAIYAIKTKTGTDVEDNGGTIFLQNNLVAKLLIINGTIGVKQFGAYGDGTNDDTVAIQNALDYAQNFNIVLFDGYFKISDELQIKKPLIIKGTGGKVIGYMTAQKDLKGIYQSADKNVFVFMANTTNDSGYYDWSYWTPAFGMGNCRIEDITIKGLGKGTSTKSAICLEDNPDVNNWHFVQNVFRNVNIIGFKYGINLSGWVAYDIDFENSCIRDCETGVTANYTGGDRSTKFHFVNTDFYSNDIGIDFSLSTCMRTFETDRCNFAYNGTGIACFVTTGYTDYFSEFEQHTNYGVHFITGNVGVSQESHNFLGTKFVENETGSHPIYLDDSTGGFGVLTIPIILIGIQSTGNTIYTSNSTQVFRLAYTRASGSSQYVTTGNGSVSLLDKLYINKLNKVTTQNLPKVVSNCYQGASANTSQPYFSVTLQNNKTLYLYGCWRSIFTSSGSSTGSVVNQVYNETTSTQIYSNSGVTGFNMPQDAYFAMEQVLASYKNTSGSDQTIVFRAYSTVATDLYNVGYFYDIV